MMKMAIRLLLDTRKGSAKELLEELQKVLFSRIKGVRESHFLLGIYDGPSATIDLACRGGPFLLLKGSFPSSTGDKTNFLEMETGQSAPISFAEIQLKKGEILFVFSHSVQEKSELISLFCRPEPQIGANSARNLDNDQSLSPVRSPAGKDHLELLGEELFGRLGVLTKGESLQSRTMVAFEVKSS